MIPSSVVIITAPHVFPYSSCLSFTSGLLPLHPSQHFPFFTTSLSLLHLRRRRFFLFSPPAASGRSMSSLVLNKKRKVCYCVRKREWLEGEDEDGPRSGAEEENPSHRKPAHRSTWPFKEETPQNSTRLGIRLSNSPTSSLTKGWEFGKTSANKILKFETALREERFLLFKQNLQ